MNLTQNITHALFFFPGTFLHELLHLCATLIVITIGTIFNIVSRPFGIGAISTIKITSFNIIPNFKTGVYGSVQLLWVGSLSRQDWHNIFSSLGKIFSILFLFATTFYLLYSISGIKEVGFSLWDSFVNEDKI